MSKSTPPSTIPYRNWSYWPMSPPFECVSSTEDGSLCHSYPSLCTPWLHSRQHWRFGFADGSRSAAGSGADELLRKDHFSKFKDICPSVAKGKYILIAINKTFDKETPYRSLVRGRSSLWRAGSSAGGLHLEKERRYWIEENHAGC